MFCYIESGEKHPNLTLLHSAPNNEKEILPAVDIKEIMADIREARFILKDPLQYRNTEFHCVEDARQHISNSIVIREEIGENYFVTEWSEWSRCSDLNQTSQVYRRRKKSNDNSVEEERYCKCSDIRPLPSPRSVLKDYILK